jgi:hypothetical protein
MLINLLIGLPMMVMCLLLQMLLLFATLRYYRRRENLVRNDSLWSSVEVLIGVMLLLVLGNVMQISIWAGLFYLLGEFQQYSEAVYHSAVNFATLGYGDFVMSAKYKLLGPLEAPNGVLMIGISTAALMHAFQDAFRKNIDTRHH